MDSFTDALIASKLSKCLPPTGVGIGPIFPWICWSIWKSRNSLLFEERRFSPEDTITKAITDAREWQLAQTPEPGNNPSHSSAPTPLHQPGSIVCFTDGAWRADIKTAGIGWILFEEGGSEITKNRSTIPFVNSPLIAEALAIREALNHGLLLGLTSIKIKSDAQLLIRAINMHEQIKEIYGLLFDIHALASLYSSSSFYFILRSENSRADAFVKLSLCNLNSSATPLCST
ncbi:uncharacterized protein LOC112085153 [Eutrema salsugineum]|uniref:uncharacterized protein LOC112085153 n=1 Tax=Eutrema salsugineum TaxID=72664 RepID=UPI000CED20EB|nr:uncharacterized protein LOC112085153 [Eutrema salsugineum]